MGLAGGVVPFGEYTIERVVELRGAVTITEVAGLGGVSARTGDTTRGISQLPIVMTGGEAQGVRWPSLRLLHNGQVVDMWMDVDVISPLGGVNLGVCEPVWDVTGSAGDV